LMKRWKDDLLFMLNNLKKGLILHFSIVILLIFFCSGCGRKGPPRPPGKEKLSASMIYHEYFMPDISHFVVNKVSYASFYLPRQ
jgi:predicted small lipoprotein YifL